MTVEEYKLYSGQKQLETINKFLAHKYKSNKYILCWFDLFIVDVKKRNRLYVNPEKIEIARDDYAALLNIMLKYPDLTFEDLPAYIPEQLYKQLIVLLRFPIFGHITNITIDPHRRNPVAVEMATIQRDVYEIIGEGMHSFLLQSYTQTSRYQDVGVKLWMKQMEISMNYVEGNHFVTSIYGMIDVDELKIALKVRTNKGIESALKRMCMKLQKNETDLFWIIRWLDRHEINYVHAEDQESIS